jgi:hypothetical protein
VANNFGPYPAMICPWVLNGALTGVLENQRARSAIRARCGIQAEAAGNHVTQSHSKNPVATGERQLSASAEWNDVVTNIDCRPSPVTADFLNQTRSLVSSNLCTNAQSRRQVHSVCIIGRCYGAHLTVPVAVL